MAKIEGQPQQSYFEELFTTGNYAGVFSEEELAALVTHEELEVRAWEARQMGSLPAMLDVTFDQINVDRTPEYKAARQKLIDIDNDREIRLVSDLGEHDDGDTSDIRLISDLE